MELLYTAEQGYDVQINKRDRVYGIQLHQANEINLRRNILRRSSLQVTHIGREGSCGDINTLPMLALLPSKAGFAMPLNVTPRGRLCNASVGLRPCSLTWPAYVSSTHPPSQSGLPVPHRGNRELLFHVLSVLIGKMKKFRIWKVMTVVSRSTLNASELESCKMTKKVKPLWYARAFVQTNLSHF